MHSTCRFGLPMVRTSQIRSKSKTRNIHDHPWIDKELLSLIKRKNKQRLKANRTGCVHDAQKFKDLRRLTKQLISQKKKEYATKLRDSVTENPKRFWSFVKSSRSVKITANFLRDNLSLLTAVTKLTY